MKKISTLIVCLLLASFVFAGVPAISRLAEPKIVEAQDDDKLAQLYTVVAKKVAEIPAIDGDFSDSAWAEAPTTHVGSMRWQAVYTDDEFAMHIRWVDPNASINSRGTWNWNNDTQSWWQTGWEPGTWESFGGTRHPEYFSIGWDISTGVSDVSLGEAGCGAFCHEGHHGTHGAGAYADAWVLLGRHGFGPKTLEDLGWPQGVTSVSQDTELIFNPTDPMDPMSVIAGRVTFVGYVEDKVMASQDELENPKFTRDTPGDQYCINCHTDIGLPYDPLALDITYSDVGIPLFYGNWDSPAHAGPLYIEIAPENWVDCMMLTQAEVDAGEAVPIADLSAADIAKYWDNYAALNGVVPNLVVTEPSESQADIPMAASWYNGYWDLELKRKLVTGHEDDAQFEDVSKDYHFGFTLWSGGLRVGNNIGDLPWTLRFEQ